MTAAASTGKLGRLPLGSIAFAAVTVLVAFLVLYPMIWLIVGSLHSGSPFEGGHLTLANYVTAYADPELPRTLLTTLIFALGQTLIALALGTTLGWIVARTDTPGRAIFEFLTLVLFLLPSIVTVVAWTLLLSPSRGLLNDIIRALSPIPIAPFDVHGLGGMILVQGLSAAPFAYLIITPALASSDVTLEEAARMAGSGRLQILWRITLPIARPALLSAAILLFITGIEAFDVPQLLGAPAGVYTFTSLIFYALEVREPPDYGAATALAVSLQLVALICVILYRRALRRGSRYQTVRGKGYRIATSELGPARWIACGLCALFFLLALILPVLVTLAVSLVPFFSGFSRDLLSHLTGANYLRLLHHPALQRGLIDSLLLAVFGGAAGVALSSVIAFLVAKERMRGAAILENLAMLPIAVPATVLAIGLLWGWIALPLPVYGTLWILAVAYVTRYIPMGLRTIIAGVVQIGDELEEASTVAGASRMTTFGRIVLPLAKPMLIAAWTMLFMLFFREFSMSILLAGPSNPVLSVVLYDYYESAETGPLCAGSLILVVATMITVMVVRRFAGLRVTGTRHTADGESGPRHSSEER